MAAGKASQDRVFPKRPTSRTITGEKNVELHRGSVVVLRPYDEVIGDAETTSTLLVDNALRMEYETLIKDIEGAKHTFLEAIREVSGSRKLGEEEISFVFTKSSDALCQALVRVRQEVIDQLDAPYAEIKFDRVFDDKILAFLATKEFRTALQGYIEKYDQLITASQYFRKGGFNYYNASVVAKRRVGA